jgi:hypothetical protein
MYMVKDMRLLFLGIDTVQNITTASKSVTLARYYLI